MVLAIALAGCQAVAPAPRSAWTLPLTDRDWRLAEILRDSLDAYRSVARALRTPSGPAAWVHPAPASCGTRPVPCRYFLDPTVQPEAVLGDMAQAMLPSVSSWLDSAHVVTVRATGEDAFELQYGALTLVVAAGGLQGQREDGSVDSVVARVNFSSAPTRIEIDRTALETSLANFHSLRGADAEGNAAEAALGILAHELAHSWSHQPDPATVTSRPWGTPCAAGGVPWTVETSSLRHAYCWTPASGAGRRLGTLFTRLGNGIAWVSFAWKAIPGNAPEPTPLVEAGAGGRS